MPSGLAGELWVISMVTIRLAGSFQKIVPAAVVTYLTSRRVKEIALRRAIGARSQDVVSLLAGPAFRWTMAGVLLGVVGAVLGSGLLRATVTGVIPLDTITVVVTGVSYLAVVGCAICVPALVALRIDPATALRSE